MVRSFESWTITRPALQPTRCRTTGNEQRAESDAASPIRQPCECCWFGDNATLSNAGALGEAVDDCDEFLVAVLVTPGGLDEVCGFE